ncbi:MAG: hypothetical protein HYT87_19805 [Nitrospirae bacterium]|nr:hypothetical protein [Nitrospirota bacterium]
MKTLDGLHQYTYDPLYRLTKADYPNGYPFKDEEFQYDPVGNRLARLTPTEQERLHKYDAANRLLEDDQFKYEWDMNGNMISKTPKCPTPNPCALTPTRYRYDAENMLVHAACRGSGLSLMH